MNKELHLAHIHIPYPLVTKVPAKSIYTPLNIVDQIKRTDINVPIWDVLALISQLKLLQQESKIVKV